MDEPPSLVFPADGQNSRTEFHHIVWLRRNRHVDLYMRLIPCMSLASGYCQVRDRHRSHYLKKRGTLRRIALSLVASVRILATCADHSHWRPSCQSDRVDSRLGKQSRPHGQCTENLPCQPEEGF